jgi:hypothetical protein
MEEYWSEAHPVKLRTVKGRNSFPYLTSQLVCSVLNSTDLQTQDTQELILDEDVDSEAKSIFAKSRTKKITLRRLGKGKKIGRSIQKPPVTPQKAEPTFRVSPPGLPRLTPSSFFFLLVLGLNRASCLLGRCSST